MGINDRLQIIHKLRPLTHVLRHTSFCRTIICIWIQSRKLFSNLINAFANIDSTIIGQSTLLWLVESILAAFGVFPFFLEETHSASHMVRNKWWMLQPLLRAAHDLLLVEINNSFAARMIGNKTGSNAGGILDRERLVKTVVILFSRGQRIDRIIRIVIVWFARDDHHHDKKKP